MFLDLVALRAVSFRAELSPLSHGGGVKCGRHTWSGSSDPGHLSATWWWVSRAELVMCEEVAGGR